MSYSHQSMGSGSRNARGYEFGRTYVVRPKGKHQATLVWLHGLGDNGSRLHSSHGSFDYYAFFLCLKRIKLTS